MMLDDGGNDRPYSALMGEEGAHLRLKLDTDEPIALGDFVGSFVGLGNQLDRFVATNYPTFKGDSEVFVQDVRDGCVVADLVVMIGAHVMANSLPGVVDYLDKGQVLAKFVDDLKTRLGALF